MMRSYTQYECADCGEDDPECLISCNSCDMDLCQHCSDIHGGVCQACRDFYYDWDDEGD